MKRLLYLVALVLAVITAIGYVIGKNWEEDKMAVKQEMTTQERLAFLKRKAASGDAEALYEIGEFYEVRHRDYLEAQQWYRAAASRGKHPGSQYKLGKMYVMGRGVENDLAIAMDWFRKAARQGDPRAFYFLGIAERDGWERKANLVRAYKWIWLADKHHEFVLAEDERYNTKTALEELEPKLSRFNIEKAIEMAGRYHSTSKN